MRNGRERTKSWDGRPKSDSYKLIKVELPDTIKQSLLKINSAITIINQ